MNAKTILAALVLAAVTGVAGYELGRQPQEGAKPPAATQQRKVLYYRNPMNPADTSTVPKKDSMGMDYVAVYEGEDEDRNGFTVSIEKQQKLGVLAEPAQLRRLAQKLHLSAAIQVNERAQYTVAPRFEGWVQQLHVNATGQTVRAGEALLTVYSPDLQSAVGEYQAAQSAGLPDLMKSARQRLNNWQISEEDLAQLQHGRANLELRSPINGVVLEKPAVNGMRFAAGDVLFKLADLSSVWVEAQVPELEQALLHPGQVARVVVDAYPGEVFQGRISFISPTLDAQTRTVRVRVELPNRSGRLRPAMFAQVELTAPKGSQAVLTIPVSAVIDSGTRQVALVRVAEGRFQPRELKLGQRTADYVEVLEGVIAGEEVVTHANFLLDSESNLKAALGAATHQHGAGAASAPATEPSAPEQPGSGNQPGTVPMEHHHAE